MIIMNRYEILVTKEEREKVFKSLVLNGICVIREEKLSILKAVFLYGVMPTPRNIKRLKDVMIFVVMTPSHRFDMWRGHCVEAVKMF